MALWEVLLLLSIVMTRSTSKGANRKGVTSVRKNVDEGSQTPAESVTMDCSSPPPASPLPDPQGTPASPCDEDANSSIPVTPNSDVASSPEFISSPAPTDSSLIPSSPSASPASCPSLEPNGSPGVDIPGVLQDLAEAGASFESVPSTAWLPTNNGGVRLSRELS